MPDEQPVSSMEALKYTRYWQEKLGLLDWDIFALEASGRAFGDQDTNGDVSYDLCHQRATIRVVREDDFPHDNDMGVEYDAEQILVHELLHIALARFKKRRTIDEEQFCNRLAETLVEMRRAIT